MKVTAIMPTAGRPQYVAHALQLFFRQSIVEHSQLVIVNDGETSILPVVNEHTPAEHELRVKVIEPMTGGKRSVGDLRNVACEHADGDFIAHWDDDDVSADDRLEDQLYSYRHAGTADLVGYHRLLFKDTRAGSPVWIEYKATGAGYAVGTSFFYRRSFWERTRFEDVGEGEDNRFQEKARVVTFDGVAPDVMMFARMWPGTSTRKPALADIAKGTMPVWSIVGDALTIAKAEALEL